MSGEVFLRPDGTTIALVEGRPGQADEWRSDSYSDRIAAINVALKQLSRTRAPSAPSTERRARL